MKLHIPFLLGLLVWPLSGRAVQESRLALRAVRIHESICMNGRLKEAVWKSAPAATDFIAKWPEFGKPSALSTEVRVLYDDRYLYVGAQLKNPKGRDGVVQRVHRRDQWSPSDWFGVYIDSLHNRSSACAFFVNAAGVQRDAVIFSDTSWDYSWDGVWESTATITSDGWIALLKIPLSLLRISPSENAQTWGINFSRDDQGAIRESSSWQVSPRGVNAFVSRFPELTGIENLQPRPRREWIPFMSAQKKFETAQSYDDRGTKGNVGLDAHLGLNSSSQLDLTVRPDFGQVEVDQAVLNLSTYETYFPEKRSFFLEGSDLFQVAGSQLFYSRRIGAGLSDPDLNTGETLLGRPQSADIAGAAKYTGKFASGFSLGALAANVETARARIGLSDGTQEDRVISPSTSFGVLRAQQQLDDRGSYLGGFGSYVHQAGADGREARVGAVDSVYRSEDRSTVFDFTLAQSEAGTKDDSSSGHRERMNLNHQWSDGWRVNAGLVNASREFDPNDLGFLNRADEQRVNLSVGKDWDQTWKALQNWGFGLGSGFARDQEGHVFQRSLWSWAHTGFTNFYGISINAGADLPAENDRELRTYDDPTKKYLRYETIPYLGFGVDTPDNRPWYLHVNWSRGWREGGPSTDVELFQSIKLNSALELQFETSTSQSDGELGYLETQGTTPIVGLRRLNEFNQSVRLAYAFSPKFTVQFFSQWLEANWNYRDLKSYVDDDTLAPGARSSQTAFSDRAWNANLITRWEFKPGSTFYFVYTHGVSTDELINDRASLSPRQDLALLRHLPSDDALQMKISYLFR